MTAEQATAELLRALIDNMRGAGDDWESLAMVVDFDGGEFSGTHGYVYASSGRIDAVAAHPFHVEDAVTAYVDSHYAEEAPGPVALLVQFDRTTRDYEITFEDADASRWKVTPANLDEIRERLRPSFRA